PLSLPQYTCNKVSLSVISISISHSFTRTFSNPIQICIPTINRVDLPARTITCLFGTFHPSSTIDHRIVTIRHFPAPPFCQLVIWGNQTPTTPPDDVRTSPSTIPLARCSAVGQRVRILVPAAGLLGATGHRVGDGPVGARRTLPLSRTERQVG